MSKCMSFDFYLFYCKVPPALKLQAWLVHSMSLKTYSNPHSIASTIILFNMLFFRKKKSIAAVPICFKEKVAELVINGKVRLTNYVATCKIKSKLTKGFVCITHTVL